jgi:hypothetical protein
MQLRAAAATMLDSVSRDFYLCAIGHLQRAGLPFLVGGAYSFARYTGIERHTKDFDIFVLPADAPRVLATLAAAGYSTELTHPHWLGKAYSGENCLDVIFASGNGVARVDETWFTHAIHERVLDQEVRLCPVEETIWSKAFVMERERFDGADIAHLIHAMGESLDWRRLLSRFGPHWQVLLLHLVLFCFVYPDRRDAVPQWLLSELTDRMRTQAAGSGGAGRVCRGTLLSRAQYLVDIEHWGYEDARIAGGYMAPGDIEHWTDAIAGEAPTPAVRPTLGQS